MDITYEEQRSNAARAERTIFVKLINEPDSVIQADVSLAFQDTSRARLPPLLSPTPSISQRRSTRVGRGTPGGRFNDFGQSIE